MANEMITTFIPTRYSGRTYFTEPYDTRIDLRRPGPLRPDTLSSTVLLASDKLLIDSSWRQAYEEWGTRRSTSVRVLTRLSDEGILEEVRADEHLDREQANGVLGSWSLPLLDGFADHCGGVLPDDFRSWVVDHPVQALTGRGDTPAILREFDAESASIAFDAVFLRLVGGRVASRVWDPNNLLGVFHNVLRDHAALGVGASSDQELQREEPDWLIGVCDEIVPRAPLFLSRDGEETLPDHPVEAIGFQPRNVPKLDEKTTLEQLDKLLEIRKASTACELRSRYSELLQSMQGDNLPSVIDRKSFHQLWAASRAELRRSLQIARTADKWTDGLTVPAAIGSLLAPAVGAIPVASWSVSKISSYFGRRRFQDEKPWYLILTLIEDLALAVRDSTSDGVGRDLGTDE